MWGKSQTNGNLIIYIYVPTLPCLSCTFIDAVSQECRALLIYAVVQGCQPHLLGEHSPVAKEGRVALLVHPAAIHTA